MEDCLIIGIDISKGKSINCMTVARKKGRGMQIINQLFNEEAEDIYYKLINIQAKMEFPKIKKEEVNNNLYKAEYMQIPFEILTEENLERLEKHCKKAIHYERGKIKKEHEVTLCLLYRYQDQQEKIEKQNKIIDLMANYIKTLTVDLKIPIGENMFWDIAEIKQYFERRADENN